MTVKKITAREARKRVRPGQASRRDFDPNAPRPGQQAAARHAAFIAASRQRRGVVQPVRLEEPHEPRRRLLTGRTVPRAVAGRTWQDLVAPGPKAQGVARPYDDGVTPPEPAFTPSATHPVGPRASRRARGHRNDPWPSTTPPGLARRRDRRPALVAAAKTARSTR